MTTARKPCRYEGRSANLSSLRINYEVRSASPADFPDKADENYFPEPAQRLTASTLASITGIPLRIVLCTSATRSVCSAMERISSSVVSASILVL